MSNTKKRAADANPPTKKAKKRKGNFENNESLDSELGINTLFSRMDSQLLADHIAQKTTRFGTELSPVELSDIAITGTSKQDLIDGALLTKSPAGSITDTSSWQEQRILTNLPDFLEQFSEDKEGLSRSSKKPGSPHTLIVAGAGLRAADIVRGPNLPDKFATDKKESAVRKFQTKNCAVAKLFAKHMKIEEQITYLKSKKTGIAVGTPARLADLIDNGALSLENLERLVVDASHIDQKKRGVMDMKDTMMPLARFLARKEFKEKYAAEEKPLSLLFY
ncbi:unnamed protein product [Clonostachys chloroleuca]|uniref:Protein CMS1 n=1 Tax=Clonostachys chloroleuca TaxID=1926264 RepID=A0AA35MC61_9HYPO|nr:unnamed protein product [Clonostachys chloroleuca]